MTTVKMDEDGRKTEADGDMKLEDLPRTNGVRIKRERRSLSSTPNGSRPNSRASSASPDNVKAASDSSSTPDNGTAPKLSRKASSRTTARSPPPLFAHLPDVTEESCETFQVINDCLYGSKHMGSSEHDALDCECAEEWRDNRNHACGEDSDCINRHTKMECVDGECNCGNACQNQRFQRKQYADVSVIKTEKKGFGLRANTDLQPNDFVFEYIGEVINEPTFRSRMMRYDKEGIKHFYFMSLAKSEFVDATKKGNLGRFCNHSCNPNCYVDKWVVGGKLRMGIFAGRRIVAGEELVFNYNVDRYGADPQPCYCGESNCTGYIGGKTQTERATKLPLATIEALGLDDGDTWDTAVAKKPRKKKPNEDDEEYVNRLEPRGLEEDGVTKVMATLMQCKEKWIAVKLLSRIQATESDAVHARVVRMHGYQILKTTLNTFKHDDNVVLLILDILLKLPRLTKNKIADSSIEAAVQPLLSSSHEAVAAEAAKLLEEWSKLETGYRIPRKKIDPAAPVTTNSFEEERRNMDREQAKQPDPFANMVIPTGPKSTVPQRNANYFHAQRLHRKLPTNLPAGWFVTTDSTGRYYFYNKAGVTQWQRPTAPVIDEPRASAKVKQETKALQDIIDSITKDRTPRHSANQTPQQSSTPLTNEPKREKWRALSTEKQMKIYENTLFPHVKYVMDKFRNKLPKEELKKFAKEISKKLVASDYKHGRVNDPTSITLAQERKVKKHVKGYFDRAVEKLRDYEKSKTERVAGRPTDGLETPQPAESASARDTPTKAVDDMVMSDVEDADDGDAMSVESSSDRKRKRELDIESPLATPSDTPLVKRVREEETEVPSPPPPPPPPPEGALDTPTPPLTEEERSMREQEEALMRENEEAQRLAEEEAEVEAEQSKMREGTGNQDKAPTLTLGNSTAPKANGFTTNGPFGDPLRSNNSSVESKQAAAKQEVLSH